jgi:hypothetical protein
MLNFISELRPTRSKSLRHPENAGTEFWQIAQKRKYPVHEYLCDVQAPQQNSLWSRGAVPVVSLANE